MKKVLIANGRCPETNNLEQILDQQFPDLEVSFAINSSEAYEKAQYGDYELIILDVKGPGQAGMPLLQLLLQQKPSLKVMVHTSAARRMYALRYYKAGARAFLPKDAAPATVKEAIRAVLDGRKYFNKEILADISSSYFRIEHENPFARLSNREFEIAAHLIKGNRLPEISRNLKLQKTTVSTYKKRILEKLNARNMIDVLEIARNHAFE